jgi:hypothetical protein
LTERFDACKAKLREEFHVKLQHEIQGVSDRVDILKRDNEHNIDRLTKSVETLSEGTSKGVNAHMCTQGKSSISKGRK